IWVPNGSSGCAIVIGGSNTGANPLRTNSLPNLRLTNNEIGPGCCRALSICSWSSVLGGGTGSDGCPGWLVSAALPKLAPPPACSGADASTSDADCLGSWRNFPAPVPPAVAVSVAAISTAPLGPAELGACRVPVSVAASDALTSPARRG